MVYGVFVFVELPSVEPAHYGALSPFQVRLMVHPFVFFLAVLVSGVLHYYQRRCKLAGHLEFESRTRVLVNAAVAIYAFGSAIALIMFCLWFDGSQELHFLRPINGLQALVACELLLLLPFRALYVFRVVQHNWRKRKRFSFHGKDSLYFSTITEWEAMDIGADELASTEIIDRQVEVIRFLKEQRLNLSHQCLRLTKRLERLDTVRDETEDARNLDHKVRELELLREERDDLEEQLQSTRQQLLSLLKNRPQASATSSFSMSAEPVSEEVMRLRLELEKAREEAHRFQLNYEVEKSAAEEQQSLVHRLNEELRELRVRLQDLRRPAGVGM